MGQQVRSQKCMIHTHRMQNKRCRSEGQNSSLDIILKQQEVEGAARVKRWMNSNEVAHGERKSKQIN